MTSSGLDAPAKTSSGSARRPSVNSLFRRIAPEGPPKRADPDEDAIPF